MHQLFLLLVCMLRFRPQQHFGVLVPPPSVHPRVLLLTVGRFCVFSPILPTCRPTEKVDVFAFGVLLYELLSRGLLISHCAAAVGHNRSRRSRHGSSGSRHGGRHSPHANAPHTPGAAVDVHSVTASLDSGSALPEQQLLLSYAQMVAGGYRPPFPAHFPAPVTELISSCWASEPHERPRMSDVLTQLQAWSQDRQLVYCLDSYLAGLADLGYGPGSMGPSCGCGCVIS
jgi:hypothetical protein